MPRNFFFATKRKTAPFKNCPRPQAKCKIWLTTISMGNSRPQCREIIFSLPSEKTAPFQNRPRTQAKRKIRLPIISLEHSPPQCQQIIFLYRAKKLLHFKSALERKRKRAGFPKFFSQPSRWGIPNPSAKKKKFRYRAKKSLHFKNALESKETQNSAPNHLVGAFPTPMPRNIFFATEIKKCSISKRLERERKGSGFANFGSQPSRWGIPRPNGKQ